MLVSLAQAFSRGSAGGSLVPRPAVPVAPGDRLAQQIVELDDAFTARQAGGAAGVSDADRAAYAATRSTLKGRLTAALTGNASVDGD